MNSIMRLVTVVFTYNF